MAGIFLLNQVDFVLKASITDPPLLLAKMINEKLKADGIKISGNPTTQLELKRIIRREKIVDRLQKQFSSFDGNN